MQALRFSTAANQSGYIYIFTQYFLINHSNEAICDYRPVQYLKIIPLTFPMISGNIITVKRAITRRCCFIVMTDSFICRNNKTICFLSI